MHINLEDTKTQYAIGGIIVALVLVGWIVFSKNSSSSDGLTESAVDPVDEIIGRELLVALEKMKTVKLDTSFVNDPVYQSLTDISVEVPKLPQGRRDPFAPIGSDEASIKTQDKTGKTR